MENYTDITASLRDKINPTDRVYASNDGEYFIKTRIVPMKPPPMPSFCVTCSLTNSEGAALLRDGMSVDDLTKGISPTEVYWIDESHSVTLNYAGKPDVDLTEIIAARLAHICDAHAASLKITNFLTEWQT